MAHCLLLERNPQGYGHVVILIFSWSFSPHDFVSSLPRLVFVHHTDGSLTGQVHYPDALLAGLQTESCWRTFICLAGHSRIFQKESLRVILPSANSSKSTPRTSIFLPDIDVPMSVHSETPKLPHTQC